MLFIPSYLYPVILIEVSFFLFLLFFFLSQMLRYKTKQPNYTEEKCHPELHESWHGTKLQECEEGLVLEQFSTSASGI